MAGKKQGTRLNEDWQPTDKSLLYAKSLGLEPHQIQWLRNQFVRYFTGPDAHNPVKKDWHRAWVNWIERDLWRARKVKKEDIQECHREQPGANTIWHARMAGWLRSKFWPVMAGPKPDEKGTFVPKEILREYGLV